MKSGKKMAENFPKQGSVYWYDPEPATGAEMPKVRPCIIVSANGMNKNLRTVVVVPLTSSQLAWPFRLTVNLTGRKSSIACDQIKVADKSRLKSYITNLKPSDKNKLFALLHDILSE